MILLDEPAPALAERFRSGTLREGELSVHPVLQRWSRVARSGLPADSDAQPEGTSAVDLAARRDRLDGVFREERALMQPIARELAARALVTIVADPDGVILAANGGGEFVDRAAGVRLVEGAIWSERARGTNAIGTAIAEGTPVAVVGGAHYEVRNRGLFCYATPVRDAYGDLVAVLDVTGPLERHDPAVGVAVQAAGFTLQRALCGLAFASSGPGGLAVIERLVDRCAGPALLVEASGAVRLANDAARVALRAGRAAPELTCERIFGVSFRDLAALAQNSDGGMRFETSAGTYRVILDPIGGPGGRAFALIVHLEPERSLRAPRRSEPPAAAVPPSHPAFDAIVAIDPEVAQAKVAAARYAATQLPVLLLAETGTGKELFARAVHAASPRAKAPFVALNCGALAESLLESELFGHAPGAFTGASRTGTDGKLGVCDGGTLFLDEIAEMPGALQAALLRVLDDGVYYRVGDARPRRADFRLVCATCRDLPGMVATGAFRRDLFYRIQGACVMIPPLRSRTDRVYLARALLRFAAAESGTSPCPDFTQDAVEWILEHDWPGNVRELKSAVVHALALASGESLARSHFPRTLLGTPPAAPSGRTREQILREAMDDAVRAAGGNLSEAARRLGIARSTLYRALGTRERER